MESSLPKLQLTNRLVFMLSLIGIVMAIYVLQSFLRGTPIVCVNSGCELVRKNPASYILGIPVPAFGLVGYILLAVLAFLRTTNNQQRTTNTYLSIMLAIATFGVGFVSWFTYTEITVIKAACTWCALSAVNMLVIFCLLLYSKKLKQQ